MMTPDPRKYWSQTLDQAYDFMLRLLRYPLEECGEPLASLADAAHESSVEMILPQGLKLSQFPRIFSLRQSLVPKILAIAEELLRMDLVLRVDDAFRRLETQAVGARSDYVFRRVMEKTLWELDGKIPDAEFLLRRLTVYTATTPKFANHAAGSALDVSVLKRGSDEELDRGGVYPEFSLATPMDSPFVSPEARRNRERVNELFAARGFLPYPYEFWHYSCGDADAEMAAGEGRPGRYGPVILQEDEMTIEPVEDPLAPLITVEDVAHHLDEWMRNSPVSGRDAE